MELPLTFQLPPLTVAGTDSSLTALAGAAASTIHAAPAGPRSDASFGASVTMKSLSATGDQTAPRTSGGTSTVFQVAINCAVGLERGEIEAREVLLVVDPGSIDFCVLLLLLAGRFRIVRPEREIFAVVADGESGNVNLHRLGLCICRLFFGVCREDFLSFHR